MRSNTANCPLPVALDQFLFLKEPIVILSNDRFYFGFENWDLALLKKRFGSPVVFGLQRADRSVL